MATVLVSLMLFVGCATREPSAVSLEPPRDGKILVFVGGNATAQGSLWVPEDASLATLEDLVGVRPEWESHKVRIRRSGAKTLQLHLDKMTRADKEKIRLQHGDIVIFVWDRCFGFAPKSLQPLELVWNERKVCKSHSDNQNHGKPLATMEINLTASCAVAGSGR